MQYSVFVGVKKNSPLGIIHFIMFLGLFLMIEGVYRVIARKESAYIDVPETMSVEEFEARVLSGAKLIILDDMVLDVSQY